MLISFLIRLSLLIALVATLTSSQQLGSFQFTLNGTPVVAKPTPTSCFVMMNVITLTAETPKTDLMLEIYRDKFPTLPAKLPIDGTTDNVKGFYYPQKMLPPSLKPYYISQTGTLIITQFDPATRTISGTFSFKANKFDPERLRSVPGESVEITNGSFEGVKIRKI